MTRFRWRTTVLLLGLTALLLATAVVMQGSEWTTLLLFLSLVALLVATLFGRQGV